MGGVSADAKATVVGEPGESYDVEWSSDLTHWTYFATVQDSDGLAPVSLDGSAFTPFRFYRSVARPGLLP